MKILTFTKLKDSIDKLFKEKKTKWLVIVGIAGIVLIMLGDFLGGSPKKALSSSELQFDNDAYNAQYVEKLQKDLTEFISKIEGVGAVEVLVTLETGVQYVYAANTKTSDDSSYTSDNKQSQKSSQESNIIIVDSGDGDYEFEVDF
jgi:stage III sporulation protein AG